MRDLTKLLLASLLLTPLDAQGWASRLWSAPLPAWRHAPFVHHTARGRTVWWSGTTDQTPGSATVALAEHWEFDGEAWLQVRPRSMPPPRYQYGACFDTLRRRLLVFGGRSQPYIDRDDLWSWNGQDWQQLLPPTSPPPRRAAAMAYDSQRDRVVLFGGVGAIYHDDTWEYDGTTWTLRNAIGPTPRDQAAMAFDVARGVAVMTGGYNPGQGGLTATWEYDGTSWMQRSATTIPGALTFDPRRGRVVASSTEWDGTAWVARPDPAPFQVLFAGSLGTVGLGYDPARGALVAMHKPNTGEWRTHVQRASGGWRTLPPTLPGGYLWDPVRQRMLVGGNPTRVWDGRELQSVSPPFGVLSLNVQVPTVFDTVRDEVVTLSGQQLLRQRGSDLLALPSMSVPFQNGGLAFDSNRNRYVVATRYQPLTWPAPSPQFQTWEYDGSAWIQITTMHVPPPVSQPRLVYDPARQVTVLTGGFLALFVGLNETWEYDGTDWRQVPTTMHPQYGSGGFVTVVRDSARNLLLAAVGDTLWAYDGTDWRIDAVTPGMLAYLGAFDPVRNKLVGYTTTQILEYAPTPQARLATFGTACSSSSAMLDLAAATPPLLGAALRLRLHGLPPEPGLAVLITGFDDQQTASGPLPLPLVGFGGPAGCFLFIDPVIGVTAAHLGTGLGFTIDLPNAPALANTVFFAQGAVFDLLLATPLPLATSQALRCVAGS